MCMRENVDTKEQLSREREMGESRKFEMKSVF